MSLPVAAVLALLLSCAAAAPAVPQAPPTPTTPAARAAEADRLAARAEAAQQRRDWKEAASLLQQAAVLLDTDFEAWDRAGWAHLDNRDVPSARKAFERADPIRPKGAPPVGGLLICAFAGRDRPTFTRLLAAYLAEEGAARAAAACEKGLAAREFTPDWNYALGYLFWRVLNSAPRALAPLEEVVKADTRRADAWLLLVEVNQQLNRGAHEDSAAERYLALAPQSADAFRLRAERYLANGEVGAAIEEAAEGIQKHPDEPALYYLLARGRERAGERKEATQVFDRLVQRAESLKNPTLAREARTQLANFHGRGKEYVQAEAIYRTLAADSLPGSLPRRNWIALLALTGKWDEAAASAATEAAAIEKAAAEPDDLLQARLRSAVAALAAGKKEAARQALEPLRPESLPRSAPGIEVAALREWLGLPTPADTWKYRRGDERWAGFPWRAAPPEGELEVRGVWSLEARGVRASLAQALRSQPGCWPLELAVARSQASLGYSEEALALLRRVADARKEWWMPPLAMGQYYTRARDRERAEPLLRRVLQLAPDCRQARLYLSVLGALKSGDDDP